MKIPFATGVRPLFLSAFLLSAAYAVNAQHPGAEFGLMNGISVNAQDSSYALRLGFRLQSQVKSTIPFRGAV
ncbi:MAG: hypothetical protein R3281_16890, partial [Balneolaceae bacterium]|nr:hypothetical protein [Balneolaceae bacterium]